MCFFLMLNEQHDNSGHKSRALRKLTCIKDADPRQGGIVQTIPSKPSPLRQAFTLALWGHIGGYGRLFFHAYQREGKFTHIHQAQF